MKRGIALLYSALTAAAWGAEPTAGQATGSAIPVAVIDGKPILESELSPLVEGQLQQLQFQEYQARRKALEQLIIQKLLALKAEEKGLTPEDLLRREVDDKLAEPSGAELQSYYASRLNLSNVPYEQVKSQLFDSLKKQKAVSARQAYIRRLREEAHVSIKLQPPRAGVSYDSARVLGPPDAPVTIVEFSDFECPYCRKASTTLKEILQKYQGRVRLAYRDFPLTELHPHAGRAAEAARCATEQGQFWAYHDSLFAAPDKLSDEDFVQRARTLALDTPRFQTCLKEGKFRAQIDADRLDGMRAGVSATPTFFINGIYLSGNQSFAVFEQIMEDELAPIG